MAARRGVTRDRVVHAALEVLDEVGNIDAVRPSMVAARLGIRSQSLYAHVDGVNGLRRMLALQSLAYLADAVIGAAGGRSGPDAVDAVVRAHLGFALAWPGRFSAAIHPPGNDPDLLAAVERVGSPLQTVLEMLGLDADERVHWTRLQLSLVWGFATLWRDGRLTLAPPPESTIDHLVAALLARLEPSSAPGASR